MRRVAVLVAAVLLSCTNGIPTGDVHPGRTGVPPVQPTEEVRPSVLPSPPQSRAARVVVSRIQIDVRISEGSLVDGIPDGQAFVLQGTAWPCERGTSFVYGHARTGVFLPLWGVVAGDVVSFVDAEGRSPVCEYEVAELHRVPSTDTSWVAYRVSGRDTLILQTSTGPNASYPEFIVVCIKIER